MRKKLVDLRKDKKLTQDDVAGMLCISRSFYGHIEAGIRNPGLKLAQKIADFFNTTVDDIFFESKSNDMKQMPGTTDNPKKVWEETEAS